jgi:ribonuclease E
VNAALKCTKISGGEDIPEEEGGFVGEGGRDLEEGGVGKRDSEELGLGTLQKRLVGEGERREGEGKGEGKGEGRRGIGKGEGRRKKEEGRREKGEGKERKREGKSKREESKPVLLVHRGPIHTPSLPPRARTEHIIFFGNKNMPRNTWKRRKRPDRRFGNF